MKKLVFDFYDKQLKRYISYRGVAKGSKFNYWIGKNLDHVWYAMVMLGEETLSIHNFHSSLEAQEFCQKHEEQIS